MGALRRALARTVARERRFTLGVAALYAVALVVVTVLAVLVEERGEEPALLAGLIVAMLVPPVLVGSAALAVFGRRERVADAVWTTVIGWVVMVMTGALMGSHAPLLHGARWVMRGTERGSVTAIARSRASWVEVTPALADLARMGHGITTSTDNEGRTSRTERYVVPIVTVLGERDPDAMAAEDVHLFLCDDSDADLRAHGPGNGTITGRVAAPDSTEKVAIADLGARARTAPVHRCVTLTYGGGTATGVFWLVLGVLIVLVAVSIGSFAAFAFPNHRRTGS